MNIEGESLRKMAGSTKSGGLSAVTGWLAARGKSKDGSGGGSKSGTDYHNETLAKMYEHAMSETSKESEFGRQGERRNWMKEDVEAHKRTKSMAYGADGSAKWEAYQDSNTGRTNVTAAGGKKTPPSGTSGNTQGAQFKRTVGKAAKDAAVAGAGAVAGAAAGAVTKNPKVAQAAATLGSAAAEGAINKVSTARKTRASGKPKA